MEMIYMSQYRDHLFKTSIKKAQSIYFVDVTGWDGNFGILILSRAVGFENFV